jgi:ABC-2 type transport system ATP-binding protein
MSESPAVEIRDLSHHYGAHPALQGVSMVVERPEIFALLGPNGGGKTTLFRILSTQIYPSNGTAAIMGYDVVNEPALARTHFGIVFQNPSLDGKLTAEENLMHQGHLHGFYGPELRRRINCALESVRLESRGRDKVERFSGGMQRRVEIAKALMHDPPLLLLDEPSTGLDPTARRELWENLERLRDSGAVTSFLTTHLLEEADKADRVAILNKGRIVAMGTPEKLKATVGGEVLELQSAEPKKLQAAIAEKFGGEPTVIDSDLVRLETSKVSGEPGARLLVEIVESFPGFVLSARVGKPTLEDVFVRCTGHRFVADEVASRAA